MARKIIKSRFFFEEGYVEGMAEVPEKEEYERWGPDAELKLIGVDVPRIDGYEKVSGDAQYTYDKILPHMAYGKILRSPYPHARITSIDVSKAKQLDGVLDIITYQNVPKIEWFGMSYLFDPHLRYEGDEVAAVAAETEQIAEDALELIEVEYEELPFVIDATLAMETDAPKVHESGNIQGGGPDTYTRGDIEKGFAEADAIVEGTYTTQVEIHNPTEFHGSVAHWEGDKLTIWDSTQGVYSVRGGVAGALNMPDSKVRVIKEYMGGGFGSKLTTGKYTVMAALLAKNISRPVKLAVDRRAMHLATGNRPDAVMAVKIGARKDGTLTAMSHIGHGAMGAFRSGAGSSTPLRTMFKCPNVYTEEYDVYINAGQGRPFRAPGRPQGHFSLDSSIDEIAEAIGMDTLEVRKKNFTDVDPMSGRPYTSNKLLDAYEQGAKAIGWHRRQQPAGSGEGPVKRGIGMATQIWGGGGGPPCYATMKLNRDGSARVIAGTQDLGTGTYTFMAQIAAEVLEIPMEKVEVVLGDTGVAPYCGSSGGSTTAPSVSPAVRDAAELMKAKLMSGAAAILEVPVDQLVYSGGVITDSQNSSNQVSIQNIVRQMRERVLVTTGARGANPDGYAINSFGAQFAEVEVDMRTGQVTVVKIVAAHDIGRVLNRKTLDNQMHGGMIQGIGYALMEERILDRNTGKMVNANLEDYKLPTIMDMPEMEIIIVSDGDPLISNTGVKGVGEPATIPTAPAIANAVYNAIGVRMKSLPITPDKVLNALYG
ncbi:MAG TPA: xanthine dehydrogenase family protein molybdopterin-binding subunit [bacterium]|nr:xanthine dehydrogenase family protein molybdopterin-binding subunit [bacterium]